MKGFITIVTGFPRSGTTLMMYMLQKAGMRIIRDNDSAGMEHDATQAAYIRSDFLAECDGCAVKVLDPMLHILPALFHYRFIFMERDATEQARSQLKLMKACGMSVDESKRSVRVLRDSLLRDRPETLKLLRSYPDGDVLRVSFERVLANPVETATQVVSFLNLDANPEAMASIVKKRGPACAPDISIEQELMK